LLMKNILSEFPRKCKKRDGIPSLKCSPQVALTYDEDRGID